MKKTIKDIREALIKVSWNVNHSKKGVGPLLVTYPNELLRELFGTDMLDREWIPNNIKQGGG